MIEIVPSQAILLLIEYYSKLPISSSNLQNINTLKKLYLSGVETQEDKKILEQYLASNQLSNFKILSDAKSINRDSTRRYFETHLAYETLVQGLDDIEYHDLLNFYRVAHQVFDDFCTRCINQGKHEYRIYFHELQKKIELVLKGVCSSDDSDFYKEYANYINKLQSNINPSDETRMYNKLDDEKIKKIMLLTKCALLGVMNAQYISNLPLNIYGTGFYSKNQKGKQMKEGQDTARTMQRGLMKNYMPLPLNDIAQGTEVYPYLKPSDQATFVPHTKWVKYNFLRMVHPYSNSISGTMLCQLRLMAYLRNCGLEIFTHNHLNMSQFIKLFVSSSLYNAGGHTLFEFTAPLSLKEVRKEFASTKHFSKISLESMFLTDNTEAFDKAIEDSIWYNRAIIQRQKLHKELALYMLSKINTTVVLKTSLKRVYDAYENVSKENVPHPNKRSRG